MRPLSSQSFLPPLDVPSPVVAAARAQHEADANPDVPVLLLPLPEARALHDRLRTRQLALRPFLEQWVLPGLSTVSPDTQLQVCVALLSSPDHTSNKEFLAEVGAT